MNAKRNIHHLYELIQKARGTNAYRGRVHLLSVQKRILLEAMTVDDGPSGRVITIDLGKKAGLCVDGQFTPLAEFGDSAALVDTAIAAARGKKNYIRTNMRSTTYK